MITINLNQILIIFFWIFFTPPFTWCVDDLIRDMVNGRKSWRIIQVLLFSIALMIAIQMSIQLYELS